MYRLRKEDAIGKMINRQICACIVAFVLFYIFIPILQWAMNDDDFVADHIDMIRFVLCIIVLSIVIGALALGKGKPDVFGVRFV